MAVPARTHVSIRARRSKLVHEMSRTDPTRTACGRVCVRWIASTVEFKDAERDQCSRCSTAVTRRVP